MSADLVKRLLSGNEGWLANNLSKESADKIEQLERELRGACEAYRSQAEFSDQLEKQLAAEKSLADRRGAMLMQIEAVVPFESFGLGNTFSDEVEVEVTAYRKPRGAVMERYLETDRGMKEYIHGNWVRHEDAQAEIARLQAEVERLRGVVVKLGDGLRDAGMRIDAARNDALEDSAQIADEYEQQALASAIRALRKQP